MHVVKGGSRGELPLTKVTEFRLVVVSVFGALYKVSGTSVYSKRDMVKNTSSNAHRCVDYIVKVFSDTQQFFQKNCLRKGTKKLTTYVLRFDEQWMKDQSSTTV